MARQLQPGDEAPNFTLPTGDGEDWELARALEKGPVVVFFYPRDDSPVCTKEVCAFRDLHEAFVGQGAEVVGISRDPIDAHKKFAGRHDLPFTLLSDRGGRVRELFGVKKTLGLLDGRVTFVIDRAGKVRSAFASALNAQKHVDEALQTVRSLAARSG
jgi:thioredoxin-dependent peroxiredoxin